MLFFATITPSYAAEVDSKHFLLYLTDYQQDEYSRAEIK